MGKKNNKEYAIVIDQCDFECIILKKISKSVEKIISYIKKNVKEPYKFYKNNYIIYCHFNDNELTEEEFYKYLYNIFENPSIDLYVVSTTDIGEYYHIHLYNID